MKQTVAYEMKPGERNDVILDVAHKNFRLSEISAKILNKIRVVAQDYLNEKVTRAVVTVPAYFTDRQRQAVKDAGKMIQLEVVRIINEPTAAALAYGIGKNLHETVVIYDLGGGTFDVSIIEIRDRVFEVKATGGDIFLGGLDFDQAMIEYVLREFANKHGIDLSTDPVAMQRIKDLAERVKIDLSSREQAPFSVPFVTMTTQGQPLNIDFVFTRKLLEEITKELIDRTVAILTRVMKDAELSPKNVDELLLVGGQTRMPAVQKRLTEIFGKAPSKGVHPDEAVAIGAALYANSLEDNSNLRLQLLDVIPMAIGLEKAGGQFHTVFPRNAAIPNAKAVEATTSYDGQTEVAMRIFQGDNPDVAHNELLGDFLFSGLKPGPAGKARLEITFDVNIEGILTMSAKDLDTGKQMKTTVRVTQH
jgi:molecular chaperone DnaK